MTWELKYPLLLAASYLWIGFVAAISFMEAWIKFRAPGVTRQIGLSIGRLVFKALNKVEWGFALAILLNLLLVKEPCWSGPALYFSLALVILLFQSFWILPALDARVELHLRYQAVPPSILHVLFIVLELLKVISLFTFSLQLLT